MEGLSVFLPQTYFAMNGIGENTVVKVIEPYPVTYAKIAVGVSAVLFVGFLVMYFRKKCIC